MLEADDAPAVLHVAGNVERLAALVDRDEPAVAVVGARRAGADGVEVARGLGRGLAAAGVTVVSGMALGIDAAAHAGALEVGGPTIAVLAGGADIAYPASKRTCTVSSSAARPRSLRCRRASSRFAGAFRLATGRSRAWHR